MKNINLYIIEKFKIDKDTLKSQSTIFSDTTKLYRHVNSILSCLGDALKKKDYWKNKVKKIIEEWIASCDVHSYRIIFGSKAMYDEDLNDRAKKLVNTCINYDEFEPYYKEYNIGQSTFIKDIVDGCDTYDHHHESGNVTMYKNAIKFYLFIHSNVNYGNYYYLTFLVTKES